MAAAKVKSFDPSKLSLIIAGVAIVGFHEGTYINIKPGSARVAKMVGGDGQTTRVMSTDKTATCEITLAQSSPSNDVLSGLVLLDSLSGLGLTPFLLNDASGRTAVAAAEGWVSESPEVSFAKASVEGRKWVIDLGDTDFFVGGN